MSIRSPPNDVAEKFWLCKLNMPFERAWKVTPKYKFFSSPGQTFVMVRWVESFLGYLSYQKLKISLPWSFFIWKLNWKCDHDTPNDRAESALQNRVIFTSHHIDQKNIIENTLKIRWQKYDIFIVLTTFSALFSASLKWIFDLF